MIRDTAYSARLFRSSPVIAVTIVSTLALGVGLTTAIFSVVYGVLLRPLPYTTPSELVTDSMVTSEGLLEWRTRTAATSDIAAYDFGLRPLLLTGEETVELRQVAVSSNLAPCSSRPASHVSSPSIWDFLHGTSLRWRFALLTRTIRRSNDGGRS